MKNQQHCPPAAARQVFKLRPYKDFALGVGAFLVLLLPLLLFLNLSIAGGIALLPAFCLFFFLESRVIIIKCPHCRQNIDTNTPWLCGYKGCRNENTHHHYPFINECEHCHFIPKAYACHHCGKPVFLTTDRQNLHMAKCLDVPVPAQRDAADTKLVVQQEEVRDLEHELRKTALKKQIEITLNTPVTPPPSATKTPEQAIEEEITTAIRSSMTLHEVERRMKAAARLECAGDEDALARKLAWIEDAIRKRL